MVEFHVCWRSWLVGFYIDDGSLGDRGFAVAIGPLSVFIYRPAADT